MYHQQYWLMQRLWFAGVNVGLLFVIMTRKILDEALLTMIKQLYKEGLSDLLFLPLSHKGSC